jgi:tetratricopeptide (TPR) repeat protein
VAWAVMSINYGGVPSDEAFAKMQPAAARALDLDPLLAEAHVASGLVHARKREWRDAETAFHRAAELNPNLSLVATSFVLSTLMPQGKLEAALSELHRAQKIDPLGLEVPQITGYVQMSAGRYDAAIAACRRVLATQPDVLHVEQVMARALFQTGRTAEAIAIFEKQGRPSSGFLGYAYGKTRRRAEAEQLAKANAGFPAREALIYAGLDDKVNTLDALERMATANDPRVGIYLTFPELALLRGAPRLAALRTTLRLQ